MHPCPAPLPHFLLLHPALKAMLVRELTGDPEDTTLRLLYTTPESLATERLL